ncbi:MAG: phosphoserine phosphatase [Myxococcota bacterium]|jgi:phosphoserine phosphatase
MAELVPAAFFRVEGTLLRRPTALAAAWLAANSQTLSARIGRLGAVALGAPLSFIGTDPTAASRITWMGLRGMSEDRLVVLGEEYFATWLDGDVRPVGEGLVRTAQRDGRRVVLVSDNLDAVVLPLVERLGADLLVANRMEIRNGRATGRLAEPVVARFGGRRLTEFADRHGLDLSRSTAYGAAEADTALLAGAGLPCAVHPDRGLRRMARDLDWPILERDR